MNLDESKKIFDQMNDFVEWFNAQPGQVDHTVLKANAGAGAWRRFTLFIRKAHDKYNQPSVGRKLKRFIGKKTGLVNVRRLFRGKEGRKFGGTHHTQAAKTVVKTGASLGYKLLKKGAKKGVSAGLDALDLAGWQMKLIKTGVSVGTTVGEKAIGAVSSKIEAKIRDKSLKNPDLPAEKRAELGAIKAKDLGYKVSGHYAAAMKALEQMNQNKDFDGFSSCGDMIRAAKPLYTFIHHWDKMEGYLVPLASVVITITSTLKADMGDWEAKTLGVESMVLAYLADESFHETCRHHRGSVCYGPRNGEPEFDAIPHNPK